MTQTFITRITPCMLKMRNILSQHRTVRSFSATNMPLKKTQATPKNEEVNEAKDEPSFTSIGHLAGITFDCAFVENLILE